MSLSDTSAQPLVLSGRPEKWIRGRFAALERGTLTIRQGGHEVTYGHSGSAWPDAVIEVQDTTLWDHLLRRGNVGAGEAYANGWWTSPSATDVVRLFVLNEAVLAGMDKGLAKLSKPLLSIYHLLRRNTVKGSRSNIQAHYDLSNDFFELFLDPTMTYSCGVFASPTTTMEEASFAKLDRLCRKLDLQATDHLLEIGTGWGSMAMHAAKHYGCRVTTTTISREQYLLATRRIEEAGLSDRIEVVQEDYRNLTGVYDKLVSVEMIEAIGHQYFDEFFATCSRLLKPNGLMALQSITIADEFYESARRNVDFIKRYIFPGCCIPAVGVLSHSIAKASDLRTLHLEDIGPHYARTLAHWREALRERWDEAQALGFEESFLRLWEYYFAYCEGGFAERRLGNVQFLLAKPEARANVSIDPLPPLAETRA